MSLFHVFNVSGSALDAQSVRINAISSNLANVGTVAGSAEDAYHARHAVFSTVYKNAMSETGIAGVEVTGLAESQKEPIREYKPGHPMADKDGFIYHSNVNEAEEMANMIAASRAYQGNIQVMNTTKQLILKTLNLGR